MAAKYTTPELNAIHLLIDVLIDNDVYHSATREAVQLLAQAIGELDSYRANAAEASNETALGNKPC